MILKKGLEPFKRLLVMPVAAYHSRKPRRSKSDSLQYYLLVMPALLLSLGIVLIPGLLTGYISLTSWNGISPQITWVGLENFHEIFADDVFWQALFNNIRWTILFLIAPVFIGLAAALLLLRRKRSRTAYQLIFLFPYVLAPVVNSMLWLNIIFNPVAGLVGYLQDLGLPLKAPLGGLDTALYAVAGVNIWHYWGFLTVIYLAALRQVSLEQVEAAMVEGANGWQLFRYVYFPGIKPTVQLMFVLIIIMSFKAFDYVWLMTGGGPAHATEMLSTYAYTFAFKSFQFGKASAVGLITSLFGFAGAVVYTWLSRKDLMS